MKKQLVLILIVLYLLLPTVSALDPVPDPDIPYCADMELFFWNTTSDAAGYKVFTNYPELKDDIILSQTVSATTGEKTIGSFITKPFPQGAYMAPGLSRFETYLNVSSTVGITRYEFLMFNVSPGGIEHKLWFGVARTEDVNELTARAYVTTYARRNYTYFLPGERLLMRVNVSTTSVTERTAYFNIAGNTKASMVQMGYWFCGGLPLVSNTSYVNNQAGASPLTMVLFIACIGIALLILSFLVPSSKGGTVMAVISPVALLIAAWKSLSIDIVTGYGVVSSTTVVSVLENHTIYQMYPEAIFLFILFVISLLNIYRVVVVSPLSERETEE